MPVTVSVIIAAYNAAATLPGCLEAVRTQHGNHGNSVELIVVDDGSCDDTAKLAQDYGAHVVHQTHQGIGAARNLGVQYASGDLIAFTDADCAPAPDWVSQITRPFADPEVMGVKGIYQTRQRNLVARFAQAQYEDKYNRMRGAERIDFVDTYSAAYRKSVFLQNPGFDPRFSRSGEDIEFSYRLAEKGYKLVFAPQAIVYHHHPATLKAYLRRKFYVGYWRVWMYKMHPGKIIADSHTPQSLKLEMGLAIAILGAALLSVLHPPSLLLLIAGILAFALVSLPFAAKAGRKDPAVGLLSPLLLFWRALSLNAGFFTALVIHLTLGFDSKFAPQM